MIHHFLLLLPLICEISQKLTNVDLKINNRSSSSAASSYDRLNFLKTKGSVPSVFEAFNKISISLCTQECFFEFLKTDLSTVEKTVIF